MKQFKHLINPYLIWAFVILVIPLILIALYAFTTEGNEVLTLLLHLGEFCQIPGSYLSECDPEILLAGNSDHRYLSGSWLSAGIYYFQMSGESPRVF